MKLYTQFQVISYHVDDLLFEPEDQFLEFILQAKSHAQHDITEVTVAFQKFQGVLYPVIKVGAGVHAVQLVLAQVQGYGLFPVIVEVLYKGGEYVVLVLEVLVHGAPGDACLAYDVGDLGIIVPVFREEFLGTFEYLVSSFGCVHPVTSITGCAVTAMHWIIQGEKGLCQLFLLLGLL